MEVLNRIVATTEAIGGAPNNGSESISEKPRRQEMGPLYTAICLQADNGNPGDSIANLSARGLLLGAVERLIYDTWYMDAARRFPYDLLSRFQYDFAALLCTPWVWDQSAASIKYELLRNFLDANVGARKIGIGVGASYLLHHDNFGVESYIGENEVKQIASIWGQFEFVTCRDRLAYEIFSRILGEERTLLAPCPSYYVADLFNIQHKGGNGHVLIYADVNEQRNFGIRPADAIAAMDYQNDLISGEGLTVMTMTQPDFNHFLKVHGRKPDLHERHPIEIVKSLVGFDKVTSPRVHACMPARSLGIPTDVIPVDSRTLTCVHVGAQPVAVRLQQMERFQDPIPLPTVTEMFGLMRGLVEKRFAP